MAYTPGTKLSCFDGEEAAVVITNNKVICNSGCLLGQTMLLVDWLILAGDTEVRLNTQAAADHVWTHAKQKAGIDPPSLAHVDLPQLLVPPPVPQLASPCCDTAFACGCLELAAPVPGAASAATQPPEPAAQSPPAAPELAAPPLAQPSASHLPELRFPPPLEALPQRHVGDKLKWELNDETYRIAVFTKKGLLEVKNVKDGGAAVHNDCKCDACWEFNHNAPWRPRLPLAKAFFETESAWRASLPQGGNILTNYVSTR